MRLGILSALLILYHMQHVFHCSPSVVPGYLDFDNLPDTNFSCEGKVIGGYYADVETGCQMFHVCTIGQKGEVTDIKFLCLNGTVFDQETRVCERVDEVDCSKTEGFYDLNLELYGNNAALSFPEEEDDSDNGESQENAETNDGTSSKQKTSTVRPLTTPTPSSAPLTPHPPSTTTVKSPVHPFVPTTTVRPYKPNQHISHFHSSTPSSIATFLAINNAFSSANTNAEAENQYDEEEEEEEEEDEVITDHPGPSHRYPVTTISSQNRPIGPELHGILHPNVNVQGTGESGFILNQANRQQQGFQPPKTPSTSTQLPHLYGHSYHSTPASAKNTNAHSKHQLNTQLILNQQREGENKQHHGFKPISNSENRNQFLFSSTTRRPPIFFTTKTPSSYSTTIHSQNIEPFALRGIGPQPAPTQQAPSKSPFPQQTNAHQVPPANPIVQQIRSNIANNGGFLTQTIQLSQNPLTFQFNSNNNNNRQGHQLFTTPSIAVIATTSSTSSSSGVKGNSRDKGANISPVISLTSSIGSTPKGTVLGNNTAVSSVQIFSETTPSGTYDEYQEGDVSSDPFFRDVPKISKPSTQLKSPSPSGRKKRWLMKQVEDVAYATGSQFLRIERSPQVGLPTEVFGTGEGKYRNRAREHVEESSRQNAPRGNARREPISRRILVNDPSKQVASRARAQSFESYTPEATTLLPDVPQQVPQFAPMHSSASDSAILESPVGVSHLQEHRRKVIMVRRPHKPNSAERNNQFSSDREPSNLGNSQLSVSPTTFRPRDVPHHLPKDNTRIPAVYQENLQEFGRNIPSANLHSRDETRRDSARSYISVQQEVPTVTEHTAGRSRHRSRQRIQESLNQDLMRPASRRVDSEFTEKPLSRSQPRTSTRGGRGRNVGASALHIPQGETRGTRTKLPVQREEEVTEAAVAALNGTTTTFAPPPQLPETSFTCADKIPGGYYADLEVDCQLFHICSLGRHGRITDNKFLCGPGTRFNQKSRTCQVKDSVDCSASASLYHLNNHFKLYPEDDVSKYDIGFEAKKVRTKRKAPKAGDGEPNYSIDNLPETSFTCSNKPKDGLYADVETQCHVFHLCRTVSGVLSLEGSFVCPPGTVFNQREQNCDTTKDVDCTLYSAPEHTFRRTGSKHQGAKNRSKRQTSKSVSSLNKNNINNLPETSFTCSDKPKDGLYADVETQCHVFHLCRTIAGLLTLEGSFVCPSSTIFNQQEQNCDTMKEVDCNLFSAPEHSFRRTGSRNKSRSKRQIAKNVGTTSRAFKLKKNTNFKKLAALANKKQRLKRDTGARRDTVDYYDYVDDNYEAHVSKPINKPNPPLPSQAQNSQANLNFASVEDYEYDYDILPVTTKKGTTQDEPYLEKEDGVLKGTPADHKSDERAPTKDRVHGFYITVPPSQLLPPKSKVNSDILISEPIPYIRLQPSGFKLPEETVVDTTVPPLDSVTAKSNHDSQKELSPEYEYEYDYEDEITTAAPILSIDKSPTEVKEKYSDNISTKDTTDATATVIGNTIYSTTLPIVTSTEEFTTQLTTLASNVVSERIENTHELPKSTKKYEPEMIISESSTHSKTDTLASSTGKPSVEYEYEYYYDEDYEDDSNSTASVPPSLTTDAPRSIDIATVKVNTEHRKEIRQQTDKFNVTVGLDDEEIKELEPKPKYMERVSEEAKKTHDLSVHLPEKSEQNLKERISVEAKRPHDSLLHPSKKSAVESTTLLIVPSIINTELPDISSKSKTVIEATRKNVNLKDLAPDFHTPEPKDLFSELFETHTNPSFLQELDRRTAYTRQPTYSDKNTQTDDITLSSLTTQFHKKSSVGTTVQTTTVTYTPEEVTLTPDFKIDAQTTVTLPPSTTLEEVNYESTVVTTAEPQQETTATMNSTTRQLDKRPHSRRIGSRRKSRPTIIPDDAIATGQVYTSPVTLSTTAVPTTIPSLFRPSKERQVYRSRYSTPDPPPVVIHPRERLASRKASNKRNHDRGASEYVANNVRSDETDNSKSHRFTVGSRNNPRTESSRRRISGRRTTTIAPLLVAEEPTITDQEVSSQNTVPSVKLSGNNIPGESSTLPNLQISSYNAEHEQKTGDLSSLSPNFSANTVDTSHLSTELPEVTELPTSLALQTSTPILTNDASKPDDITTNPSTTENGGLLNKSSVGSPPIEFPTGKENTIDEQKFTTSQIFSTKDLVSLIPTTNPSIYNHGENTSPPSHVDYTLSSVNSQPSVSLDDHVGNDSGFVCSGKELHRYHPDPHDCRMFHYCSPGFHSRQVLDFRFTCDNGTAFRSETEKCENEDLVSRCDHTRSLKG